ncbi:hypothetical protein KUTeg_020225 [Tegillarca granosa]|uniref:guanylate cyclase n=1 Tax=Tegillarca granosa TaxID=220873 RepID=A0ABQ9E777_TEGGR|nr:hypothetical protein KUTeg_020225 [Tegillarca granosa]
MLCLTALPVLGLWAYTVYTLADTIESKQLNEKTRNSLSISIKLSRVIHRLQRERDMSMLYLSALGPETKTFLLQEYIETDKELAQMSVWPVDLDRNERQEFKSKEKFQENLSRHRQILSPSFDPIAEMYFYTALIDKIILWLYDSITESKFSLIWKSIVAYQKITSGKEDVGLERALGTMFYARGGFQEHKLFEFTRTARLYSERVDYLYTYGVTYSGVNITEIIYSFRSEIQYHNRSADYKSIQKARWLFDNMTTYLELLYDVQRDLGEYVIEKVDQVIQHSTRDLAISATFLVLVIIVCPLVIFATENLTSSIQKYALTLVDKTKELTQEQKRTDSLLYQMVPQPVAEKLKNNVHIDAEYFKTVTILFSDIYGFARLCANCSPLEIVQILNQLYGAIDDILDDLDVYKVETVNDCYMVASGLPNRNGGRHVVEIADFSIALVKLMKSRTFGSNVTLELRIGINTGPCMAGVVGSVMPRYCLFGDTVNTASRMKSYGQRKYLISSTVLF